MQHGGSPAPIGAAMPQAASGGDPGERPVATGPAAPLKVGGAVSVLLGLLFAVPLIGALNGSSSIWLSIGPPLAALGVAMARIVVRSRKQQAALARARAALASSVTPVPVRLHVAWGGSPSKVRNRFLLHRSDTGQEVGPAPVTAPDGPFDPRGQLWAYGALEPGSSIALRGADDRAPLLSIAPIASAAANEPMAVHPSSDAINRLLGWDGDPSVPVAPLPAPLAAAAWETIHRQRRALAGLVALLALPAVCTVLQPGLVGAMVLTAAVWGGWFAFSRWGSAWVQQPLIGALEASGAPADDARFVATALTAVRFGLGLPPDPTAPADVRPQTLVASAPPGAAAPASGWGYAPQTAPAPPAAVKAPGAAPGFSDSSDLRSRSTISLLVGLVLVVGGALVFASSAASSGPPPFEVQGTVTEAPTAGGGVRLDVPMGFSQIAFDGGAGVPPQSWETDDLDPADVRVGDVVPVELNRTCFCDPQIPSSGSDGGPKTALGLVLVGLGIVVAVAGRYLPARRTAAEATAPEASAGAAVVPPPPVGAGWGPPAPPPAQ